LLDAVEEDSDSEELDSVELDEEDDTPAVEDDSELEELLDPLEFVEEESELDSVLLEEEEDIPGEEDEEDDGELTEDEDPLDAVEDELELDSVEPEEDEDMPGEEEDSLDGEEEEFDEALDAVELDSLDTVDDDSELELLIAIYSFFPIIRANWFRTILLVLSIHGRLLMCLVPSSKNLPYRTFVPTLATSLDAISQAMLRRR